MKKVIKKYISRIFLLTLGVVFLFVSKRVFLLNFKSDEFDRFHMSAKFLVPTVITSWLLLYGLNKFFEKEDVVREMPKRIKGIIQGLLLFFVPLFTVLLYYYLPVFHFNLIYARYFDTVIFWWDVMNVMVLAYVLYKALNDLILHIVSALLLALVFLFFLFMSSDLLISKVIQLMVYVSFIGWYSIRLGSLQQSKKIMHNVVFFLILGFISGWYYVTDNFSRWAIIFSTFSVLPYLSLQIFSLVRGRMRLKNK